jgi:hypothetical protein
MLMRTLYRCWLVPGAVLVSAVFGLALAAPSATARSGGSTPTVRSADLFPFDFGNVQVNHTRTVQIPVQLVPFYHLDSVSLAGGVGMGFGENSCFVLPQPVGPATCDVAMTFKPTSAGPVIANFGYVQKDGALMSSFSGTFTGNGVASDPSTHGPYWPGWDIARGVAVMPTGDAGYVLDGYGGLHRYSEHGFTAPPPAQHFPYWPGWNIARGVALLPSGTGGYVLDGFGGLHPFAVGTNTPPPAAQHFAYWPGRDLARGVTFTEDGSGGYVVDLFGGVHRFTVGGSALPPAPSLFTYWPGRDIARGIAAATAGGGWVVDLYGGTHRFSTNLRVPPVLTGLPYFAGFPIVRGLANRETIHATIVDGYGGIHVGGK